MYPSGIANKLIASLIKYKITKKNNFELTSVFYPFYFMVGDSTKKTRKTHLLYLYHYKKCAEFL